MGGVCGAHGGKGEIVLVFVGKREGMGVLARTGCKRRLVLKLILQKYSRVVVWEGCMLCRVRSEKGGD